MAIDFLSPGQRRINIGKAQADIVNSPGVGPFSLSNEETLKLSAASVRNQLSGTIGKNRGLEADADIERFMRDEKAERDLDSEADNFVNNEPVFLAPGYAHPPSPTETEDEFMERELASFDSQLATARERGEARLLKESEDELTLEEAGSSFNGGRGIYGFTKRIHRNASIGILKAALNMVESIDDVVFEGGAELIMGDPQAMMLEDNEVVERAGHHTDPVPPLRTMFPGFFESAHGFLDQVEADDATTDDLVQIGTQFAIPFSGWLKAYGGLKNAVWLTRMKRLSLAEFSTAATALDAHEGRVAEVLIEGRKMENQFGELLNKVAPDGSLLNAYADLMTADRESESAAMARFKNGVDSLLGVGVLYGFFKPTAMILKKMGKQAIEGTSSRSIRGLSMPENAKFIEPGEDDALKAIKEATTKGEK